MNHRLIEDWLLSDEPLDREQQQQLQEHLRSCAACSGLAEVNLALRNARTATPAEGFVERFQVRLSAHRQAQRKWRLWGILSLTVGGLGILVWFTWPFLNTLFHSPVSLLATWVSSLASLFIFLQTASEAMSVLLRVIPNFIPTVLWIMFLLGFCGMSILWAASMRKIYRFTKGV